MSLENIGLFKVMGEKMNWLGQRQVVIAGNITNADTPGAKPQDLQAFSFKRALQGGGTLKQPSGAGKKSLVAQTAPNHIQSQTSGNGMAREIKQKTVYETAPAGNAVIVEEQLMKASKTAMDYQATANLYKKHVNLIMLSLGRNGG